MRVKSSYLSIRGTHSFLGFSFRKPISFSWGGSEKALYSLGRARLGEGRAAIVHFPKQRSNLQGRGLHQKAILKPYSGLEKGNLPRCLLLQPSYLTLKKNKSLVNRGKGFKDLDWDHWSGEGD